MGMLRWLSGSASVQTDERSTARDSADALVRLHGLLVTRRANNSDGDRMRGLIDAFAVHTRHEHLPPEQMIVRLKHAIDGALPTTAVTPIERDEIRSRAVHLAIAAYYDNDKPRSR
jgi:hypothetical protein